MNRRLLVLTFTTVLLALMAQVAVAQTPLTGRYTYQGQLKQNGSPITGTVSVNFTLWDAAGTGTPPVGGNQIGAVDANASVVVTNGLFTVQINDAAEFGANAFVGDARWLQVTVNGSTLGPRQPVNAAPYALYALDGPGAIGAWNNNGTHIFNTNAGNVGIGLNNPTASLDVTNTGSTAGIRSSTSHIGVHGIHSAASGSFPGVFGETESASSNSSGVRGYSNNIAPSGNATGVWGRNLATNSDGYGVRGTHDGAGTGVYGEHLLGIGSGVKGYGHFGVVGNSNVDDGYGGVFGGNGFLGAGNALLVSGDSLLLGAVRIGGSTSDPTSKVTILNGTDTAPASGGYLVMGTATGANLSLDNNEIMARSNGATATLALNAQGGNITLIQAGTGGVSIGTTALPTGVKLAVNGKVLCEEMEVQLSQDWPDYVFEPDYALMPLAQVESFIQANGHLPDVRSAAEVTQYGVNVGEMQTTLLRKVEELTLHMIDLNKQVAELKRDNEALRARLGQ